MLKFFRKCKYVPFSEWKEFEGTKGVIRIRKTKKYKSAQWPNEKGQNVKQVSKNSTPKTTDQATRTPLKRRCTGSVFSSCSPSCYWNSAWNKLTTIENTVCLIFTNNLYLEITCIAKNKTLSSFLYLSSLLQIDTSPYVYPTTVSYPG